MEHTWYECKCKRAYCMFCEGGLSYCTSCGGAEGSLPTECPGVPISEEHQQLIYKSTLDFRDGQWMQRPYESWETPDVGMDIIVDAVAQHLNQLRKANKHATQEG